MSGSLEDTSALAERYRHFASDEARGSSALYESLSNCVAESEAILSFLAQFPPEMQQPNLFLAAVRHVAGTPSDSADLIEKVAMHNRGIATTMRARTTQTNEPGRCAALLPVLADIPGPLALLEVGAAAGLCLLPDQYGYDYGRVRISAPAETRSIAPVLECEASDNTPLPEALPSVVWRGGLDLRPIAVDNAPEMAWLETLVWPEQTARLRRLRSAISVAREIDPGVVRGDLRSDLASLAAQARRHANLVVFHTAVLTYVAAQEERDAFARECRKLGATWICNEWPYAYPDIAAKVPEPHPKGKFLLAVNGRPVAWTMPHGQRIDWI